MQHFRALTMGKPVIMGRKTYLSIGKPLAGRTTIVVSRDPEFAAPGIVVAPSLDAALAAARGDALRRNAEAIVIAGGADLYAQALPRGDASGHHPRAQARRRRCTVSADRSRRVWREIARDEHAAASWRRGRLAFVTYDARPMRRLEPPSAA